MARHVETVTCDRSAMGGLIFRRGESSADGEQLSGRAAPGQEVSNKSGLPCCYAVRLLKAVTELLLGVRDTMDPLQCGMG